MEKYPHQQDFVIKETKPPIGGVTAADKISCAYDLVEQVEYLYVRVVKAKNLEGNDMSGSCDPYVEVKLGNYRGQTKHFENKANPEWNQVFAFSKDRQQASVLEVFVKDKKVSKDNVIGRMFFELHDVTKRIPPDSPLAPQWYRLESQRSEKEKSELMLAVWRGTQADEAFPDAWHSDAASVGGTAVVHIRSKVYHSPKLWYMRVNVIEAHDLLPSEKGKFPECFVRASHGNQICKTKICKSKCFNASWNEDLIFVVAEPFEEPLILAVEEKVGSKEENMGKCVIPLHTVQRRLDHKPVHNRWHNLEKYIIVDGEQKKDTKFASRIHLRISLDGGYHVMDESTIYSSDFRPTAKQLWKSSVGILELGILSAQGLIAMKSKEGACTTDAYCVAKYGQKWVRTRTIIGSMNPKWNEQYTWEVFDPCTVITIGVFDNSNLPGGSGKDAKIGRVRIRLSTLETDRVNTHLHPLVVFQPSGVKKTGELELAVRFTCLSLTNMNQYTQPLLPKMHYALPFSVAQLDMLRHHATQIVSMRLGRAEPPLRKEVVEDILNVDVHLWSMRRSKANFCRLVQAFGGFISVGKSFDRVCNWKNPITTIIVHILFIILILYPELILPTIFLYCFIISVWRFTWKPRHPPHIDVHLSQADIVNPDERDEEFDTFPTSRPPDIVRMRYDRLRSIAGRIQTVVGDLATQGERLHALTSWRDPRATAMFSVFCLCAATVLYVTPFQVVALLCTFYILRHPRFREKQPSVPLNFFRRLPSRADVML